MNTEINQIVQQLFRKATFEEVTEEELNKLISEHPYLSVCHLLLAKKKYQNGTQDVSSWQHAALYLNNPLWVEWVLDKEKFLSQKEFTSIEIPRHRSEINSSSQLTTIKDHGDQPVTGKEEYLEKEDEILNEEDPDDTGDSQKAEIQNEPLLIQSYHTVDYFASQGIRLKQAEFEKDRLGQQLRSFTDWLRSMKKLPDTTLTNEENTSEQTVRIIAEHSIEEKEVLTEAMAEVWKKQGNNQKASDIYHKLSLLNPSKSAYFAAKIDQL